MSKQSFDKFIIMKNSKTEVESTFTKSKITAERKKTISTSNNTLQPANVNSYQHFLTIPSANNSSIQWAFNLRSNPQTKSTSCIASPPQTYYKNIQARKVKHTSADIDENVNISEFQHLTLHRVGPTPSCQQLRFETTLRTHKKEKSLLEKQRRWCTIPKIERHQDPKFIKSKSLKKKIIQPQQMDSGFDGMHNYPKFSQKIVQARNCNQYRHMIKGKINLPSISWQVNLRSYEKLLF